MCTMSVFVPSNGTQKGTFKPVLETFEHNFDDITVKFTYVNGKPCSATVKGVTKATLFGKVDFGNTRKLANPTAELALKEVIEDSRTIYEALNGRKPDTDWLVVICVPPSTTREKIIEIAQVVLAPKTTPLDNSKVVRIEFKTVSLTDENFITQHNYNDYT
jgi:hypothetical protein